MSLEIKTGDYTNEKEVVVKITETKELVKEYEVSEQQVLDTIVALEARKADAIAKIDEEIAINNEMLNKVRSVDRKSAVAEVKQ